MPVTQVITVQNTTPPVIAAAPGPVTVQCASAVPVAGTLPATDTCGGTLTATASDGLPVGRVQCNYTITRTWTVSDACGNAAVPVTQVITVQNTTPPVIAAAPGPVTVQCASAVPVAGTLPATDTCGGTLTATASDGLPVGSVPCNDTLSCPTRRLPVCGNAAVPVTQVITVQNTTPPVIAAAPGPVTVQCASAVP